MAQKPLNLLDLLQHPSTRAAVQRLSEGADPRALAAELAGDALQRAVAKKLGVPMDLPPAKSIRTPGKRRAPPPDIIDAEYTVISVGPGVKRRQKV